jgi:hypothetical protein
MVRSDSFSSFIPLFLGVFHCLTILALEAAVEPVSVQISEAKAYTGQRLPFFVELRSKGSFGGATSFTPP